MEFESNKITLNVPQEGITLVEGWKIMPHIAPVVRIEYSNEINTLIVSIFMYMEVMKRHVDTYQPGKRIPSCQLSAVFMLAEDKKVPLLQHQVKLVGAKEPFNVIAIELPTMSGTQR